MTLRSHVTALALVALAPVAVFAVWLAYLTVEHERETFRQTAQARTLSFLTTVDSELNSSIAALKALAAHPSLTDANLAYFRRVANEGLQSQPDWINLTLKAPDGRLLLTVPDARGAPPEAAESEGAVSRVLRTQEPTVGDLAFQPGLKRWAFAVYAPVSRGGRIKYLLSATVAAESMNRIIAAQRLPRDWGAVILDRSNRFVSRSWQPEKFVGQPASQSLRDALARAPSGWFRGRTVEGVEVYSPYWQSDVTGWTVSMGYPASAVDAVAERAAWLAALGILIAIGIAVVVARVVSRRISRPIGALAAAADAMAQGNAAAIPAPGGIEEVGRLAAAMRASAQAIAGRESGLEREKQALRESEHRFRLALEASPSANIMVDAAGRIVLLNRQAERLFGYEREELIGRPVDVLVPQAFRQDHAAYRERFVAAPDSRPMGAGRELHGLRKDGTEVPVEIGLNPLEIDGRTFVLSAIVDVTERKRVEEALREADRHKDEFLAMLSHELRNPLAGLSSAAHVLRVADPSSDTAAEARRVVERQTRHMARLVGDLLDISRITFGKLLLERERIDLADAAARLLQVWRSAGRFERHAVSLEASPAWIDADRARIEQILGNLLDNALKLTPAGKAVHVRVRAEDGAALLEVADEGAGFEPAEAERLFELFVSGKESPGLGIGLALVKRLAQMHGGTVRASSPGPGRGAQFSVRLPRVDAERAAHSGPAGQARRRRSVLIVEDNDDARRMLETLLAMDGHAVRAAGDARGGLALANEARPDLALIDIRLPDMDGYELARRLRARGDERRIALVALTGFGTIEDRQRALEAGFDAHLVKPVSTDRLRQVMDALA